MGDITRINGAEIPIVDVITGGSPCQDLSVAGKRAGLDGERSGLFMEQIRIVKEMREHDRRANRRTGFMVRPRFMVWENVAGAFSSGKPKGADFQAVLTEIVRVVQECPAVPLPKDGKWSHAGCLYDEMGGGQLLGEYTTHSFGECPKEENASHLSQILADLVPRKYYLSARACQGILNRASKKGKPLPKILEQALRQQASPLKSGGGCERDCYGKRAGKGALIQSEKSGTLGAVQDQTLFCPQTAGTLDASYYKGAGERNGVERDVVCVSQDRYDQYTERESSATIKQSGGIYGGDRKHLLYQDSIGSLTRCDSKYAGNQYVNDGKVIIDVDIGKPSSGQ